MNPAGKKIPVAKDLEADKWCVLRFISFKVVYIDSHKYLCFEST